MKKKNILFIMADQLRNDYAEFACTPNIDSIARKGLTFTRAVCNSPVCAPSRCSMAGGVYARKVGVLDNHNHFPVDHPTYYQALRLDGYRVAAVGKTDLHKGSHFLGENGDIPLMYHLGFTDPFETEGKMNAAHLSNRTTDGTRPYYRDIVDNGGDVKSMLSGPYQHYLHDKGVFADFSDDYAKRMQNLPVWFAEPSALASDDVLDAFIGQKSCEFLQNVTTESPWHLFVSFVGPHDPWDPSKEYYEKHKDATYSGGICDTDETMAAKASWVQKKSAKMSKDMKPEDLQKVKRHYAAMINLIDDWVGKILDVVRERGMEDDTTIIVSADHGEMLGDHGLFQKSVMYEGALRVPLIIYDKDMKKTGSSDVLAELVDMYPTILDIAGVTYDKSKLDGVSLYPLMTDNGGFDKRYQISELRHCRMIFDGRYKLIENYNDVYELYDLSTDPHELNNIVESNNKEAERLRKVVISMSK